MVRVLGGPNFGPSAIWLMSISFSATHFKQHSKSRKMYLLFGVWSVVCGQTETSSFINLGDRLSLSPTHFTPHSKSRKKMYLLFGLLIEVYGPPKGVHTLQTAIHTPQSSGLTISATNYSIHHSITPIFPFSIHLWDKLKNKK